MFSIMLGLGRSLYAKYGKNIGKVLFFSAIGASVCYLTAAISGAAVVGLIACALTGFCTAMMWPGSLIAVSERFPHGGVMMFALMAAGGDLGASVGPQLVGFITDKVKESSTAVSVAAKMGITPEALGMKCGIFVGFMFSLAAVFVFLSSMVNRKKYLEKE